MAEARKFFEDQLIRLSDHPRLAERIWTYWLETMRTDGAVDRNDSSHDWTNIEEVMRRNFIDSIRVHVSDAGLKMIDKLIEMELPAVPPLPAKEASVGPTKASVVSSACYLCAVRGSTWIIGGIPVCERCHREY